MNLDPWDTDATHYAVAAYAGALGEPTFMPARNLEFWQWWLDEAVPAAWRSVPE